ncbi:MAG: CoA pyrophosphatase [Desulfobacteraceae bacterium]
MKNFEHQRIAQNHRILMEQIRHRLDGNGLEEDWGTQIHQGKIKASAVLFLLTRCQGGGGKSDQPCLLLNKRSSKVLQPGDLCCPGGGVERLDRLLSSVMQWPMPHLRNWAPWHRWKAGNSKKAQGLALLLTTALREGWEEMRLNPLKVDFIGPLPSQKLVMFNRRIHPLVGWVPTIRGLVTNWEVDRIVLIPLRQLFDPHNYARYRLRYATEQSGIHRKEDLPCFIHHDLNGREILWGATFRITMDFLQMVFGFQLPDLGQAPVIKRVLGKTYLNGSLVEPEHATQIEP